VSALHTLYPGYSWFFNHHAPCYEPDTFLAVLQIALRYNGQAGVGDRITADMAKAGLLTLNVRKDAGRPQAWRDYQQAFAEIGAVCSTRLTQGKIIVTPAAEALLDGEADYQSFVSAQALGYQYPNGLHLHAIKHQIACGVRLKPFLLLLQVLSALHKAGRTPYITREEIQRVVAQERDNSRAKYVARDITKSRRTLKNLPRRVGDTRNFSDIMSFLDKSTLFQKVETPSPSLALRRTDQSFIELVDRFIEVESNTKMFYEFRTGSRTEALGWFSCYGSYDRLENLTDPMELTRNVAVQEAEDEAVSITRLSQPPVLVEMKEPPKPLSKAKQPALRTTEQVLASEELKEKARRSHIELVTLMWDKVRNIGAIPREDKKGVDLHTTLAGRPYYFEMKAGNRSNWLGHIRRGMAQLYEYSYRCEGNKRNPQAVLCLVLSSVPDFPDWFLEYLTVDRGVHLCWREDRGFKCPPRSQGTLRHLL